MNSVRKKLFWGFAIILMLLISLSIIGIYEIRSINNNVAIMYNDHLKGNYYIQEARYYISRVQRAEKNVLLSTTIEDKKEHSMEIEDMYLNGIIGNLKKMQENSHDGENPEVTELISKVNEFKKIQEEVIRISMEGNNTEAINISKKGTNISESIEKLVNEISEHQLKEADQKYIDSMNTYKNVLKLVIVFIIVAVIASLALSYIISRSIVNPLNKGVAFARGIAEGDLSNKIDIKTNDEIGMLMNALNQTGEKLKNIIFQIKVSSSGVESSSEQLSATVEETNKVMGEVGYKISDITGSIEEVVSSIEVTSINIQNIASSAAHIAGFAKEAQSDSMLLKESSLNSGKSIKIVVNSISDIEKASNEAKISIEKLNILSQKIGDITSLITNIARQTNLLALNAAIEAARAGEHGRGFSVVAEEVRKLAEESGKAAKSIEGMILEVQEKTSIAVSSIVVTEERVKEGIVVTSETYENISNVISSIEILVKKIDSISNQAVLQANATDVISEIIKGLSSNAQKVSIAAQSISTSVEDQIEVVEEVGATSQQLYSMTEELNNMIKYFKL